MIPILTSINAVCGVFDMGRSLCKPFVTEDHCRHCSLANLVNRAFEKTSRLANSKHGKATVELICP